MGPGLYFLKMPVNLSQYRGKVGLFNSRSIAKRSKVNSFVTSNYRNNTYIACSLIFVNKFFLFLSLFSVLFFLKDNVSKNNRQFLVLILFSSTILLIPFVFFFSLLVSFSDDVETSTWDLIENQMKLFQSAIGILTVYLLIISPSCIF